MYNRYRNNMDGGIYTLYLKPMDNGNYTIDTGITNVHLTEEEKKKLIGLIDNKDKTRGGHNSLIYDDTGELKSVINSRSGGSRRRPSSRKYKKSKRVFRKKSRSTRRR